MAAHRAHTGTTPRTFGLPSKLRRGYAEFYADNDATHELTISLGIHPRRFEPEVEFIPQMRRIVREIAHQVRGVPKRRLLRLHHEDAPWVAGFYEHTDAAGLIFPHWHGVISLNPGEEPVLRRMLVDCVGKDESDHCCLTTSATTRPVITIPRAKPTFHLATLTTPEKFISYAAKKTLCGDTIHWTTADFL